MGPRSRTGAALLDGERARARADGCFPRLRLAEARRSWCLVRVGSRSGGRYFVGSGVVRLPASENRLEPGMGREGRLGRALLLGHAGGVAAASRLACAAMMSARICSCRVISSIMAHFARFAPPTERCPCT